MGIGIMNSTDFLLLANSNPEVDKNQEMELTIGSLSFYVGPSGSTRLLDLAKLGPSASKTKTITTSGSSVGSSSEINSPVSLAATENMQKKLKEFDETRGEPDVETTVDKPHDNPKGTSPLEAAASPEAYTSYASLSLKQQKRIITQAMKKSTCKSTNQGATARRRRRKFTSPLENGESSCQPSITTRKYPQIQEEKF
jgi:hypothetical protein